MGPMNSVLLPIACILVVTVMQGWLLTLLAKLLAVRWQILDQPDNQRKAHAAPTPLLGGAAVLATLALSLGEYQLVQRCWPSLQLADFPFPWMMMFSATLFCGLGLWDDKFGMRPGGKLLLQTLATLPYAIWMWNGDDITVLGHVLNVGWISLPFMVIWIVGCVNAVNLLDGLDGVASTVGIVISLTVAIVACLSGQPAAAVLSFLLAMALLGFLTHNFPPASIFLGDAGSLTIGFLLSALAVEGTLKKATGLPLLLPLVLLSIPAFDTLMAIMRRVLNGRGIGQGDRLHLHHCLKDRGLGPRQVLVWFAVMCSVTGLGVIGSMVLENAWIAVAACLAVFAALIGGRVFGYNETTLLIRYMRMFSRLFAAATRNLQSQELLDRVRSYGPEDRLEIWRELQEYVAASCGTSLEFSCDDKRTDTPLAYLNWRRSDQEAADGERWNLGCTRERGPHMLLRMEVVGDNLGALTPQRLDHLLALLDAYCGQWPLPVDADEALPQPARHRPAGQPIELRLLRTSAADSRDTAAQLAFDEPPERPARDQRKAA